MSYDTHLTGPRQALTEFGRAALAGLGVPVNVVTPLTPGESVRTLVPTASAVRTLFPRRMPSTRTYVRKRSIRIASGPSAKRRRTIPPALRYRGPDSGPPPLTTNMPRLGGSQHRRARKTRYHSQLGRRPGKYATRRHTFNATGSTTKVDKDFANYRLIKLDWSEDETKINKRRGQLVNVKGVKLDHFWVIKPNTAANESTAWPLQVRWAVINPKDNDGALSIPNPPPEFFIAKDPEGQMSQDFPTTGSYFQFMGRKINREKYGVLAEGSFIIKQDNQPSQSVATNPTELTYRITYNKMYHRLRVWIPINRQMKWADNTGANPETNIYLCWWYCAYGDDRTERIFESNDTPIKHFGEQTVYFSNAAMFR